MLRISVETAGRVAIFRCQGRIVAGEETLLLRDAMLSQTDVWTSILDLAEVEDIDAAGLGLLLELQTRARSNGTRFKLTNVGWRVLAILELTQLDRILEVGVASEAAGASREFDLDHTHMR